MNAEVNARKAAQRQSKKLKPLIGVLASHDSPGGKNKELAELFQELYDNGRYPKSDPHYDKGKGKAKLGMFHFLFTGGTFKRIVLGTGTNSFRIPGANACQFVKENSTRLPDFKEGGVTVLANFVVQRQCVIVWPFLDPTTTHWLNPDNLALFRLCDIWKVKRLMNPGSVRVWFKYEARRDAKRNLQRIPQDLDLLFGGEEHDFRGLRGLQIVNSSWIDQFDTGRREPKDRRKATKSEYGFEIPAPLLKNRTLDFWSDFSRSKPTIALIAHDAMKDRMLEFAIDYEKELGQLGRILATGTTGREVKNATKLSRVHLCRSGPKGGDIEIATEILYGRCDVVVFFLDPLRPHPHTEDIRTLFSACMRENGVLVHTNEMQARQWMDRVFR